MKVSLKREEPGKVPNNRLTEIILGFTRSSIPALCLVLSLGCANVNVVMRDASGALMEVMTLTEFDEGRTEERLYAVEERILDTCQNLFTSTDFALLGEDIPLLTQLGALFSSGSCRQTVDDALQELDAIRETKKIDSLEWTITQ